MSNIEEDQRDLLKRKYSDVELLTRLITYIRPHWVLFSSILLVMLFASLLSIIQPLILANAIDKYIIPKNVSGLGFLALQYFIVSLIAFLLEMVSSYFTMITGLKIITKIRQDAFYKLQELSMDYYDREASGRIISRVTNDVERLLNLLSTGIIDALVNSIFLGLLFFVLIYLDFRLTMVVLFIFPFLAGFIIYFRIKARNAWQYTRRTLAKVTGYYQEAISGIEVSKAFAVENYMMGEFEILNLENYQARIKALILFAIMFPIMDMILALGTALVLTVGGTSVGTGTLSVGILVAFISYLTRISQPIMTLSNFYNDLLSSMAATERIFDILDRNPSVIPLDNKILNDIEGNIEFQNVSFSYGEDSDLILKDFNLSISAKSTFALVGQTGAGKTTLINLLCRFYDYNEGKILLDRVDIKNLNLKEYRNCISVIPQNTFLFSGTIRDNLLYGKPDATNEEIENALLRVGAFDFIMAKGMDMEVGERGSRLSMGERQLICFARAIISNPRILILDEATSSVDAHTELVIQQSMHHIIKNRTTIIIAHRLSTIKSVDQIIVMGNGKIIEKGSFDELIKKNGVFTDLYKKQFSGYEI